MVFGFSSARKGYGSKGVPGFNNSKKRGTIARGNFDGDSKPNRGDCDPFNFKKQDGGEQFKKKMIKSGIFNDKTQAKIGRYHARGPTSDIKYDKEQKGYYFEVEEL